MAATRKTVTVLFADVTSSSRLGDRLDAESLRTLMGRFFEEMRSAIEYHGGTVEKFVGDAVMAVFGIPQLHEDDPLRALRAAVDMRSALAVLNEELRRDWGEELEIRVAVNTGEVVADDPGGGHGFVSGDPVVVAKRLEEVARPGDTYLGEATYQLVRDAVRADPLGPLPVKGKRRPIPAWRLRDVVAWPEAPRLRLDSPLVGRDAELTALRHGFEQAISEQTCRLVTVLGPAGIGKSRLTHEFVGGLGEEASVVRGRCLPYGEGITFWPLVEIVKQAASLTDEDSPEITRAKIATLLPANGSAALVSERIAAAVGRAQSDAFVEETFWAVRRFLEALAGARPLVAIVDDVQWAEETFLDLIAYITGLSKDAPILLCCLGRPELLEVRPTWALQENATLIRLDPLAAPESDRLIHNLLGRLDVDRSVTARIAAAAEGSPLFVEEMLHRLVDDGLIVRRNGRWVAAGDLASVSVPATIRALLGARLDRLENEERAVLQRASVVGHVFWWGAAADLSSDQTPADVGSTLQSLVRKDLIRPERSSSLAEDAFRFRHILLRDAAYESLPKKVRADLHERLAGWLERRAGSRAGEYEEIVGYHLEQAFRYRAELGLVDEPARRLAKEAATRLAAAGRRALALEDVSAAANLLGRAAQLRSNDDPDRLALLPELGLALRESGELAPAEEVLDQAIELAAGAGDRRSELSAVLERASLRLLSHPEEADGLLAAVDDAIPTLAQLGDEQALAKAWYLVGLSRGLWRCRFAEGEKALERALQHAERAGDRRQEADILTNLGYAAWAGPMPVPEAIERCERMLAAAEGNPSIEAGTLRSLAPLKARTGNFGEARELLARAASIYADLGMSLRAVAVKAFGYGDIEMLAGNPAAAERQLQEGYDALHRMGERGYLSAVAAFLAAALYAQGRHRAADELTAVSERSGSSEDVWPQVLFRSTRAKLLAQRGEYQAGETLAREALALAAPTDWLEMKAGVLLDLAEVLQLAGRPEESAPLIEEAVSEYERKGNVVSAERARALLHAAMTV